MTDLTEQLKKCELPFGDYYIKLWGGEITTDTWDIDGWQYFNKKGDEVVEVLEPVPTYEEWQKHRKTLLKTQEKNCDLEIINTKLKTENEKLKELLGECLAHLSIGELGTSVTPLNFVIEKIKEVLK